MSLKTQPKAGFSLLILLFLMFIPLAEIRAADGIKVSPSIIEKTVMPGEVFEQVINIGNESVAPVRMYIFLRDFTADGENGSPKLLTPGSGSGSYMSSWIGNYEVGGVDIPGGGNHDFKFRITVPKDVGPGGYYGALVFGTKAEDIRLNSGDKGAASAISQQAGALLLMTVPGDANESANIRDFATSKSLYNTPFKVDFSTRIENLGNVHIKPRGVIQINNMFDKEVVSVKINDSGSNVMPKSIRKFPVSWSDKMGFGRYKATLAMTYGMPIENGGNGQQSLTSITYFWVLPYKIVAFTVLAIVIAALLIYLLLRRYKNQAIKIATMEAGMNQMPHYQNRMAPQVANKNFSLMMIIILLLLLILLAAVIFLLFA